MNREEFKRTVFTELLKKKEDYENTEELLTELTNIDQKVHGEYEELDDIRMGDISLENISFETALQKLAQVFEEKSQVKDAWKNTMTNIFYRNLRGETVDLKLKAQVHEASANFIDELIRDIKRGKSL